MNSLVAQMTGSGRRVQENVPVPLAAKRPQQPLRRKAQRRTAAAIMGLGEGEEGDESIIPKDADEVENYGGPAGAAFDRAQVEKDEEPPEPTAPVNAEEPVEDPQLITPSAALVAPDVTPSTLEPIDPSAVPAPKQQPAQAAPAGEQQPLNPLEVFLGRGRANTPVSQPLPNEPIVTAEAAQASVAASLGINNGGDLLGRGKEMPAPATADTRKIMEAFSRFGPR